MTIVGGLSPFAIAWSNGNTTEDLSALAPGTYSVTVTDNASQVASDVITIGSNPIYPDPIVGPITGATSAQAWMVFSYSVPSTSGSSFTWSAVNGTITGAASNASSILWNAGPNGKVYVQETDANGCSAYDSLAINILFVGVKETHENSILIYPNPTEGLLNINLLGSFQGPMMQIFDLSGQVVLTQRLGAINNRLDVSALTTGIYLITLSTETGTVTDRIVVR